MNVTIIGRMTSPHLDDEVFAELWTNAAAEGAPVGSHPHLQECAECRLRFASFGSWLHELRAGAVAEADWAMSPERLKAQQASILRRIEAAERPARVIAFPAQTVGMSRPASARRWISGAAAAGLIAGLGLGQLLDLRQAVAPAPIADSRPAPGGPAVLPAVAVMNEEADLAELEAVSTPRYETLRAYDSFTPRAADFIRTSR